MGATAVRQAWQILEHVETIVAIELLCAAQGVDFRRQNGEQMGRGTEAAYQLIRQRVPFLDEDTFLAPRIESVRQLVADGTIKRAVEERLKIAD